MNGGWRVAMGTLAFERGASTLGQQLGFEYEFRAIVDDARRRGVLEDAAMRQRLAEVWIDVAHHAVQRAALDELARGR